MRWISAARSRSLAAACLGGCCAALAAHGSAARAATPPPPTVVDNQLEAGGVPLQLRGVNRGAYTSCSYNAVYDANRPADLNDDFADGPVDLAAVQAMTSWGINAVRLPVNEGCWLGDPTQADAANASQTPLPSRAEAYSPYAAETAAIYRQKVESYVNLLTQQGLYVILALQYTAPRGYDSDAQDYFPDATETPAFWTQAATAFAANPDVLFDPISEIAASPYNGPYYAAGTYGYTSADAGHNWTLNDIWNCWLNGCANVPSVYGPAHATAGIQTLITTIRGTGAANPIMVSSPDFAFGYGETGCSGSGANCWQDYTPTDPDHALVVDAHVYDYVVDGAIPTDASGNADPSQAVEHQRLSDAISAFTTTVLPIAAHFPVVLGELGETDCNNADASAVFVQGMLAELDLLGDTIGALGWTWDSEYDGFDVLGSGWQCPTGPFGNGGPLLITNYTGAPTAMGRVFKGWMSARAAAGVLTTATVATAPTVPDPTAGTTTTTTTGTAPGVSGAAAAGPTGSTTATTTTTGATSAVAGPVSLTLSGTELHCEAGVPSGATYTFLDAVTGATVAGPQPASTLAVDRARERALVCEVSANGVSTRSGALPVPGAVHSSPTGGTRLVAVCPAQPAHGCRVTLTLTDRGHHLGRGAATLRAGALVTVRVALSPAGRRLLRRHGHVTATLHGFETIAGVTTEIVGTTLRLWPVA